MSTLAIPDVLLQDVFPQGRAGALSCTEIGHDRLTRRPIGFRLSPPLFQPMKEFRIPVHE